MKLLWKKELRSIDKTSPDDIIKLLLENRGITDEDNFINPPSPLTVSIEHFNKSYSTSLKRVFKLLEQIKKENKTVVVYTDYDADGITGGAILWETLHLLGFSAMPYVPHRVTEGYGFSVKGLNTVKDKFAPALIISVDHGITAEQKIAHAKAQGIPIIVTDHHLKSDVAPTSAFAVFHIPELSGSGVSYFFSKAIFDHFSSVIPSISEGFSSADAGANFADAGFLANARNDNMKKLQHNFSHDYISLASIGTVADLVPLLGVSRSVVATGLKEFSKMKRVGMKELLLQAGIEHKEISTYEIGFVIAPRINAIGRLEHAIDALRLLCTTDAKRARELTDKIGKRNTERQDLVAQSIEEAEKKLQAPSFKLQEKKIIILSSSTWHEGIIGLIASKLVEKYYRPVIVMTKSGPNYKGSARSIPAFHITNSLREHKDLLIDVGGHAQAAGFTLESTKLEQFQETLTRYADSKLTTDDLIKTIKADLKLPISFITKQLVEKIRKLKPFGMGNPNPTFISTVVISRVSVMGKDQQHLKFYSEDGTEFVAFGKGEMFGSISRGEVREVVYYAELNEWNGNQRINCRVLHL